MKAILIEPESCTVQEVEWHNLADLQALVGGYIEIAWHGPAGDVLFVDEEGLLKRPTVGFWFAGRPGQNLVGRGLIVGRERQDEAGGYLGTDDPVITVEQVRRAVAFLQFG